MAKEPWKALCRPASNGIMRMDTLGRSAIFVSNIN